MGQMLSKEDAQAKRCRHKRGKDDKCDADECMAWQWVDASTKARGYCAADHVVFTLNVRKFE